MKLLDNLENYIQEDANLGKIFHSPWVIMPFYNEGLNSYINDIYKAKKAKISESLKNKDYNSYIFLHERPYRLEALLKIIDELPENNIDLIISVWIDSESPSTNLFVWKSIFNSIKEGFQSTMENLPEFITIYRGYCSENDKGISWTLSKEVADFFANRFGEAGKVKSITINKNKAWGYTNNRNEEEIIYWSLDED